MMEELQSALLLGQHVGASGESGALQGSDSPWLISANFLAAASFSSSLPLTLSCMHAHCIQQRDVAFTMTDARKMPEKQLDVPKMDVDIKE
jgi:hypothetical protein